MRGVDQEPARKAISGLKDAYASYMAALGEVVESGDEAIALLVEGLDDKKAAPLATALGYLMDRPGSDMAIPRLLDWAIVQSPVRPEAVNALIRADARVMPQLLGRLRDGVAEEDDEAVRHLLDLGARLSEPCRSRIALELPPLLGHGNPHIREAAADAAWRLGLPEAAPAAPILVRLSERDPDEAVRLAAAEALTRLGV